MNTIIIILLVGIIVGYFAFETFLKFRSIAMKDLMLERGFYDPILIHKAVTKFWIPLERLINESSNCSHDRVSL